MPVVFAHEIVIRNLSNSNSARIRNASTRWIDFDPTYANDVKEKLTAAGKHFRGLLTNHAFTYKIEEILIGGISRGQLYWRCLKFTIAFLHRSDWVFVYAGSVEGVPDCIA